MPSAPGTTAARARIGRSRTGLYRNEGGGRFTDATETAGISKADGAGLGVSTGDYNGDGWLDLYVANDATPNQLWINQRNGTFEDEGLLSGSALNAAGNPEGSMGIASGDFDLDGDEDLFVTNIVGETFAMYVNDGRGSFDDARSRVGLAAPTAAFTGFGTDWFDYDNDGWLDLFIANGAVNIVEAQRGEKFPFRMRNQLFRNTGAGRFEETSKAGGPAFDRAEIGRGAAFGDIDNDGDVDVVVTNNNGPVRLLLNQAGARNHWLQVRLAAGAGQPLRIWRLDRCGARRTTDRLASRPDRRQLSVGERRARACRPGHLVTGASRERPVARWRARALDGCAGGPRRHAAPRNGEMTPRSEALPSAAPTAQHLASRLRTGKISRPNPNKSALSEELRMVVALRTLRRPASCATVASRPRLV